MSGGIRLDEMKQDRADGNDGGEEDEEKQKQTPPAQQPAAAVRAVSRAEAPAAWRRRSVEMDDDDDVWIPPPNLHPSRGCDASPPQNPKGVWLKKLVQTEAMLPPSGARGADLDSDAEWMKALPQPGARRVIKTVGMPPGLD